MNFRQHAVLPFVAMALSLPLVAQANSLYHPAQNNVGFTKHPDHWQSTKTRAEVLAEVVAARKDGTLRELHSNQQGPMATTRSGKTRQQVAAEVLNESTEQRRAREAMLSGG